MPVEQEMIDVVVVDMKAAEVVYSPPVSPIFLRLLQSAC